MIPLARVWYNFIADYHQDRQLDHARRRDRALRKLERMERAHQQRETQREIQEILDRHKPKLARHMSPVELRRAELRLVAATGRPIWLSREEAIRLFAVVGDDCQ